MYSIEEERTMKIFKNDNAFTGLEAAIVLIAFIVVAAVFSYVILGAGFFTTQKSQEVVHSGVAQASSSLELIGDVYALTDKSSTTKIGTLEFTLGLTAGGSVVDLSKTVLTYSDATDYYTLSKTATTSNLENKEWCIFDRRPTGVTGDVVEAGEQFIIRAELNEPIDVNHNFILEVKPPTGATFAISRTTPPQIDNLNVLY